MSHKHHRNVRWTTRTVYFYSAQKQLRFAALWSSFAPPFSDAVGEGLFSAVALEMDPYNRIFTTLPVVPVPEMPSQE